MFAKERQDEILEIIKQNGAVTTAGLVKKFGVSIETIRRDLLNMEHSGLLLRVHGGAVETKDMKPFLKLSDRSKENNREKNALSYKALESINEGDIIGIDAGSTAISFAHCLKEKFSKLTVITYSLDVFNILCKHKDFSVILCGGHFLADENAFGGLLAVQTLQTLSIQKAYIFPSAVSLKTGICDYQEQIYPAQKQMMNSSSEVFILADSSKFEKRALYKLDEMRTSYTYITDDGLSEELKKIYAEGNIKIVTG